MENFLKMYKGLFTAGVFITHLRLLSFLCCVLVVGFSFFLSFFFFFCCWIFHVVCVSELVDLTSV